MRTVELILMLVFGLGGSGCIIAACTMIVRAPKISKLENQTERQES
jgi:hypothetical protein